MTSRIHIAPAIPLAFACATGAVSAAQELADSVRPRTVTITGCVQPADDAGSSGPTVSERTRTPEEAGVAANTGEPGVRFVLTDAEPPSANRRTRGTSPPNMRYVLIGDADELAKYQGRRVRAHGTLAATPTKPAETAPVGTSGSLQFPPNAGRLTVTSLEQIAATCR